MQMNELTPKAGERIPDRVEESFAAPQRENDDNNQVHTVEWDASLDELKPEESAEAVWSALDLKTRFRQAQPRLTAPKSMPGRETRKSDKVEDVRHVSKPPDVDDHVSKPLNAEPVPKPTSKAELEDFLDDLLG
ncbi:hypothetical protein M422DRAFT_271805 [Sphaerobolus stellatus SS14]|uniref:Uncharacterized protein n=1 Tax=Sphaerobolus stellatus (strain SS14) TaxID=990650 RepID=A0A0C9UD35_SPHS4|nr:hypothetical protein M422DRAFT_271805 [Sphaerobolus stellatus SS14]